MRSVAVKGFVLLVAVWFLGGGGTASAQVVPWIEFVDPASGASCGLVNVLTAELVVLEATGELEIITGGDAVLLGTEVDADGEVFFDGVSVGFVEFAADGDGARTLWLLDDSGLIIDLDAVSNPFVTNVLPQDLGNVPCDPCLLWDDRADCPECIADSDCVDGDACTDDACVGGVCVSLDIVCDDNDPCTDDSCDGGACVFVDNGVCVPAPRPRVCGASLVLAIGLVFTGLVSTNIYRRRFR